MIFVIAQHVLLKMQQIDPCDVENSSEDMARQQDKSLRTANSFHEKNDDKYTMSLQSLVFLNTGGRIPLIREMTTDEFGLRSVQDIDLRDLRMSSKI
jgi:hypothetical protein